MENTTENSCVVCKAPFYGIKYREMLHLLSDPTIEHVTSVQGLFARYEALRNKAEILHVIGPHRVHTESFR